MNIIDFEYSKIFSELIQTSANMYKIQYFSEILFLEGSQMRIDSHILCR